jgi:hypothetical protein
VKDACPCKHGGSKKQKHGEPVIYNQKSAWWGLPYWKDLLLPHNLDVMHIEKNISDNILWTLLKVEGKTKDTTNARLDLHDMDIRPHDMDIRPQYHGMQQGTSLKLPEARYVMKEKHRAEFCKFLKGVKFSDGYATNLTKSISADGTKVVGKLKMHTCHVLL